MFGVYINLDKRTDRRAHIEAQLAPFQKNGYAVTRLAATPMPGQGALGCALSHCRALEAGIKSGCERILVLEDDFQWELQPSDIDRALQNLPPDYDVLCLTYYLPRATPFAEGSRDSDNNKPWIRGHDLQTTAGYIVRTEFARDHLLPIFEAAVIQLRDKAPLHRAAIDVAWKPLQLTHRFYMAWPRLARQLADSRSDILGYSVSVTDHGSSGVAVVLHDGECSVPLAQIRNHGGERVARLLAHVRQRYPLLSYVCICSCADTRYNAIDFFNFFRKVMSPRSRPRALIGLASSENKLCGDCVVSAEVVDEYIRLLGSVHYTSALPQACARLKRVWDRSWPFPQGAEAKQQAEPSRPVVAEVRRPRVVMSPAQRRVVISPVRPRVVTTTAQQPPAVPAVPITPAVTAHRAAPSAAPDPPSAVVAARPPLGFALPTDASWSCDSVSHLVLAPWSSVERLVNLSASCAAETEAE